jgi:hypothetical protein
MRYFSSPEAICIAVCQLCAKDFTKVGWERLRELDPELLDGPAPTNCDACGRPWDV